MDTIGVTLTIRQAQIVRELLRQFAERESPVPMGWNRPGDRKLALDLVHELRDMPE